MLSKLLVFFAIAILLSVLFLTPEVSMKDGFVEYVLYGPGPWGWGRNGGRGWRPWHHCRFCPHRRRYMYFI